MEITNSNAVALLPYVATLLRDCSFFAVDLEFSGLDHDSVEADAETPEKALHSLMRKPSDLYPAKLKIIKQYSIMQLGISIFTELTSCDVKGVAKVGRETPLTAPSSAADYLRKEVAEFLAADVVDRTTYAETTTVVERMLTSASDSAAGFISALKYLSEEMMAVAQSLEFAAKASGLCVTAGQHQKIKPLSGLWYHYRFLEALSRAVASYRRENTTTGTAAIESPVARYQVHTFSALMFPAATDSVADVTLNIDTAEFLVKNDMDLTRWVKEGLRFAPTEMAAAHLAKEAKAKLQEIDCLAQPSTVLPGYKACIGGELNELLPLSPGELQLVRFVISLSDAGSGDMAAARAKQFYMGALRPLISFARGIAPESTLPEPIYTKDNLYKDEMDALAAIGMTKVNRKFMKAAISSSRDSGGRSSLVSHSYGGALLETLLYATEVQLKPIVFFNGYTDVMFLLLALYSSKNMPPDLLSFKSLVRRHFPSLFDTRILSCAGPLQSLGNFTGKLSSVVDEMSKVSSIGPHVSFNFDPLVSGGCDATQHLMAHNAAFDALLTGKLFAFAKYGLENAKTSIKAYENVLATYTTLIPINLQDSADSVLPEVAGNAYYLTNVSGLWSNTIRETLQGHGITAVVLYRGNGYTIQPVGAARQMPNLLQLVREALCTRARAEVNVYQIAL
ncbi:ribonuclease, putative [Leishmania tarentolae]|uniref:Ribonuclease, putative n=1 Tax=Leishmania tarentolae TaxID=5689 RepID=A0A640KYZ5_LEITA|nr:ribonuclease, putative [Leishmania tarentolae]